MLKTKLYTLDWGKNTASMYDGNPEEIVKEKISKEEILKLPFECERGSLVIGERAHFGVPRLEFSRAQPFNEQLLLELYKNFEAQGITFKLFPEKLLPKAAFHAFGPIEDEDGDIDYVKGDDKDPISIYKYYLSNPNMPLMSPPKDFGANIRREIGDKFRKETNLILNFIRSTDGGDQGYFNSDDLNTKWFMENFKQIHDELSETTREAFGIRAWKNDDTKVVKSKLNHIQVFTTLALLRNPRTGQLRKVVTKVRQGKDGIVEVVPSWKFIKKYVCAESPHHFKGGVARSNVYNFGLPKYVRGKATKIDDLNFKAGKPTGLFSKKEKEFFKQCRSEYKLARKELFFLFKKLLTI